MYFIAKEFGLTDELNLGGKTPWQSFMLVYLLILKNNPNFIFEVVSTKPM
ncbi:HrgA protein, partial [Campylobacter fetus subsp. fetus]